MRGEGGTGVRTAEADLDRRPPGWRVGVWGLTVAGVGGGVDHGLGVGVGVRPVGLTGVGQQDGGGVEQALVQGGRLVPAHTNA